MSATFNPGPGWHEEPLDDNVLGKRHLYEFDERAIAVKKWVRDQPASPLPTEPGYYVAERPSYGDHVVVELLGSPAGQWVDAGDREYLAIEDIVNIGTLVRLEPRDVTVRFVLARVRMDVEGHQWVLDLLDRIAKNWGVES